ncbi:hypothetical protein ACFPRL_13275 [Pseudoclavibacter helvolus]
MRITSLLISRPGGRSRIRCGSLRHSEALLNRIGKVRNKFWVTEITCSDTSHKGALRASFSDRSTHFSALRPNRKRCRSELRAQA